MPLVNIYMREGTTPEHRRNVSLGIHRSMVDVLKVPQDDQFHLIHELKPENVQTQPVSFGIRRGEGAMFIQLFFNDRDAGQKADLFAAVRENLRLYADVPEEDIMLCVVETNRENWWAAGRTVNPRTGFDERMDHVLGDTAATTD
ncbi:tautomerase family protein [Streptomyces sp. SID8382]|uniref:tautomerase family protein n=1 Tax=Streptomyces malaysiensis TaxID=92644 RepID=UPI000C2C222B|nr:MULTISPECIES: tautomerase family protein [unclassified Streptomyces]AUA10253.1 4-oxalocrotonate tautomerase [Streptomyces sp. M56]MYX54643.1 tautomerase family protein [Streptomyces sp. SID8382]